MGHSARAKFKREIRVQRTQAVEGTTKDQLKAAAVQAVLAAAAAAPRIPVSFTRTNLKLLKP
jgi:hypothetical protein